MEKILEVTEIKPAVLESFPPQLSISASSLASTPERSNPELKPHVFIQPPPDGIYNFDYLVLNQWCRPQMMGRLFSVALKSGSNVGSVQSVIRGGNIKAESQELKHWPCPIKIYTLGRFEIVCEDKSLRFPGKAQHKPLELLKCLCAYGGHAVNQDRLIDALWPDAAGDAGEQALRTTLHRLRKLLRYKEAVRLEDRHLSLDMEYIWVDSLAFNRIAHHPDMADQVLTRRALSLYRGLFLEGETSSWALTFRDRLQANYMNMAERFGKTLEQESNWADAERCYLNAIEVDPLAETFYRRLMNIYISIDRRAEALTVYQRCRKALLSRLGISPAPDTQALYQNLVDR